MAQPNVQFAVAAHVMTALAADTGGGVRSAELASSVNAEPSFVRRVLSKLAKAGLVSTTRGKHGACALARPATKVTLLDIYRASEAPPVLTVHRYPVTRTCKVSRNIKRSLDEVLQRAQAAFERSLAAQTLANVCALVDEGR